MRASRWPRWPGLAPDCAVHDGRVRQGRPGGAAGVGPAVARSSGVRALHEAVDGYIAIRRSLGFKLVAYPWMLHDFVDYLESHGEAKITTQLALEWAQLPGAGSHLSYLGKRLCVVRGFARHQRAFDPDTEVPAAYLMGWQACRAIPYIYSEADIRRHVHQTESARPDPTPPRQTRPPPPRRPPPRLPHQPLIQELCGTITAVTAFVPRADPLPTP
jgi:hypothetical protein